jgi:hypothetical protein
LVFPLSVFPPKGSQSVQVINQLGDIEKIAVMPDCQFSVVQLPPPYIDSLQWVIHLRKGETLYFAGKYRDIRSANAACDKLQGR